MTTMEAIRQSLPRTHDAARTVAVGLLLLLGLCASGCGRDDAASAREEGTVEVFVFEDTSTELHGLVLSDGRVVVPALYRYGFGFSEGLAAVAGGGSNAFIDLHGQIAIPFRLGDMGTKFSEGLVSIDFGDDIAFLDRTGKIVIGPMTLDYNHPFSEGFAVVEVRVEDDWDRYWYIDRNGRELMPDRFSRADSFKDGIARVRKEGKWGFINRQGEYVVPPKYAGADWFHEGLARVSQAGLWGYIDRAGREVVPLIYDNAYSWFSEGAACVYRYEKGWGFVDAAGREFIPCQFRYVSSFHDGLAPVLDMATDRWGFINKAGNIVIAPQFDRAFPFQQDRARVNFDGRRWTTHIGVVDGGKWGFIDKTGELVIPAVYDRVTDFSACGVARVWQGEEMFMIDINGQRLPDPGYTIEPNKDISAIVPASTFDYLPDDCPRLSPSPAEPMSMANGE